MYIKKKRKEIGLFGFERHVRAQKKQTKKTGFGYSYVNIVMCVIKRKHTFMCTPIRHCKPVLLIIHLINAPTLETGSLFERTASLPQHKDRKSNTGASWGGEASQGSSQGRRVESVSKSTCEGQPTQQTPPHTQELQMFLQTQGSTWRHQKKRGAVVG